MSTLRAALQTNPNPPVCWDLLILTLLAAGCLLLGGFVYWLQKQEEWHAIAREKRLADEAQTDAPLIELEAGRRYNIPVEHLRGMEVRVY